MGFKSIALFCRTITAIIITIAWAVIIMLVSLIGSREPADFKQHSDTVPSG